MKKACLFLLIAVILSTIIGCEYDEYDDFICAHCGNPRNDSEIAETVSGDFICLSCAWEKYQKCNICYKAYDDTHVCIARGICENCFWDNKEMCEECDTNYYIDDMVVVTLDDRLFPFYFCVECASEKMSYYLSYEEIKGWE